jgi:hypothetical protein
LAKKTLQLSAGEVLTSVPFVNEAMKLDLRKDGSAIASIPMQKPRYLVPPFSWLLPYSSHKRVELDRLGIAVLGLCDGKRRVEEIIEVFAREHLLSWRESQICVVQFLRQIVERRLIVIVGLPSKDKSGKHERTI